MRSALLRAGLVSLVVLGVLTAALRILIIVNPEATAVSRAATAAVFPEYVDQLPPFEQHFAARVVPVLIHVVPGALFLALGLLQFSPRIRARHLRFHRASGRVLIALAVISGASGIWMGVVAPYSPTERLPSAAAGAMFLLAPIFGLVAIRRGDVARHREWMIRFFAVGAGIVVIRLVSPLVILVMRPAPYRDLIGVTFWAGWIIAVAAAEVRIRATRETRRLQVA
jgi:uncharacterized membrane protein